MSPSWLSGLLGRRASTALFDPACPELPLCVIGDVHGRIDLLERIVSLLPQDRPVFLVGDVIDRGDHSAEVLRYLVARPELVCIRGNHEAMMTSFLLEPEAKGGRWLRNGGLQTLASFGLSGLTETAGEEALRHARDAMFDRLGDAGLRWLTDLPAVQWSGNVVIAHAGANPDQPLDSHYEATFVWGHPDFLRKPRQDGFWVVHGHSIVDEPRAEDGRISIDTGAYATGRLSAAIFTPGEDVRFVTT